MFEFQIKVKEGTLKERWVSVAPSDGTPYQFETEYEAKELSRFYPFIDYKIIEKVKTI